MKKTCENCKFWKSDDETSSIQCTFLVYAYPDGAYHKRTAVFFPAYPKEDWRHPVTLHDFGCNEWQVRKREGPFSTMPPEAFADESHSSLWFYTKDKGIPFGSITPDFGRRLCRWLNALWAEHRPKVRIEVKRCLPDHRDLRYRVVAHLGTMELAVGERWLSREEAKRYCKQVKEALCQS